MTFKEFAKKHTVFSELMDGRTKVEVESLKNKIIEIDDFEIVSKGDDAFCVCTSGKTWFFGGMVISDLFTSYVSECGYEQAREEVRREHIKLKLTTEKSKNNRNYTKVEVVD